jgi:hypothetical protein
MYSMYVHIVMYCICTAVLCTATDTSLRTICIGNLQQTQCFLYEKTHAAPLPCSQTNGRSCTIQYMYTNILYTGTVQNTYTVL